MKSHLQKLPPMAANLRRDDDDTTTTDDERRRHDASHANTAPTPRPPTINGNPSLRIREKGYHMFLNSTVDMFCRRIYAVSNRSKEMRKPRAPLKNRVEGVDLIQINTQSVEVFHSFRWIKTIQKAKENASVDHRGRRCSSCWWVTPMCLCFWTISLSHKCHPPTGLLSLQLSPEETCRVRCWYKRPSFGICSSPG